MGKAHGDALAQTADAHHQLGLIIHTPCPVGNEKRLTVLHQSRVGLQKYHRFLRTVCPPVQLLRMLEVVHANAKYLHSKCKGIKKFSIIHFQFSILFRIFAGKNRKYGNQDSGLGQDSRGSP